MSLSEILEAVSKLTPAEKAQVAEAVSIDPKDEEDLLRRREELHKEMLAEGWIKRLPTRSGKIERFSPIKLDGKPLSETVIEDRR